MCLTTNEVWVVRVNGAPYTDSRVDATSNCIDASLSYFTLMNNISCACCCWKHKFNQSSFSFRGYQKKITFVDLDTAMWSDDIFVALNSNGEQSLKCTNCTWQLMLMLPNDRQALSITLSNISRQYMFWWNGRNGWNF